MTTIDGFELRLPTGWVVVPEELTDAHAWARVTASELLSADPEAAEEPARRADTLDVLAEQLVAVSDAVRATGVVALTGAALVTAPSRGVVDALVTLVTQPDLDRSVFLGDLAALVRDADAGEVAYAGTVEGEVEAGAVGGLHLVLGSADVDGTDGLDGVVSLEERVVVGVFPAGSRDMIEVTAVARGLGTFEDMPQALLDLLAGLSVEQGRHP